MTDPGPDNQIARHGLMLASDDKICKFFAPVSPQPAPHRAALRCKVAAPPATRHLHSSGQLFHFFVRLLLPILVSTGITNAAFISKYIMVTRTSTSSIFGRLMI